LPRPGADAGAVELEVRRDDECPAVDERGPAATEEDEQAAEPQRPEHVEASRDKQAPRHPAAAEDDRRRDDGAYVPVSERAPAERERCEVDQSVTGRDEGRDVVQAVDVDTEPSREDVFHCRREDDDDGDLDLSGAALPPQRGPQQEPGPRTEESLQGQRGTGVETEDQEHPGADNTGDPEVARQGHLLTMPRGA
jgi:hypothetical protein